jgi:hypothetical protein
MINMSLRDGDRPSKQSLVTRDCFATCAGNDMQGGAPRDLQSHKGWIFAGGEELSALLPSILDKAFKGEL